jgi:DNA-binding MarR family transcriptional regulator
MPEPPPFSPSIALLSLGRVWEVALDDALRPLGLTTRKYGLLGHIHGMPDLSFSELARRSRITTQSAHAAVAAFAAAGLVGDATARAGAASRLRVTPAGEQLLADAGAVVAEVDAAFTAAHAGLADALREHVAEIMARR